MVETVVVPVLTADSRQAERLRREGVPTTLVTPEMGGADYDYSKMYRQLQQTQLPKLPKPPSRLKKFVSGLRGIAEKLGQPIPLPKPKYTPSQRRTYTRMLPPDTFRRVQRGIRKTAFTKTEFPTYETKPLTEFDRKVLKYGKKISKETVDVYEKLVPKSESVGRVLLAPKSESVGRVLIKAKVKTDKGIREVTGVGGMGLKRYLKEYKKEAMERPENIDSIYRYWAKQSQKKESKIMGELELRGKRIKAKEMELERFNKYIDTKGTEDTSDDEFVGSEAEFRDYKSTLGEYNKDVKRYNALVEEFLPEGKRVVQSEPLRVGGYSFMSSIAQLPLEAGIIAFGTTKQKAGVIKDVIGGFKALPGEFVKKPVTTGFSVLGTTASFKALGSFIPRVRETSVSIEEPIPWVAKLKKFTRKEIKEGVWKTTEEFHIQPKFPARQVPVTVERNLRVFGINVKKLTPKVEFIEPTVKGKISVIENIKAMKVTKPEIKAGIRIKWYKEKPVRRKYVSIRGKFFKSETPTISVRNIPTKPIFERYPTEIRQKFIGTVDYKFKPREIVGKKGIKYIKKPEDIFIVKGFARKVKKGAKPTLISDISKAEIKVMGEPKSISELTKEEYLTYMKTGMLPKRYEVISADTRIWSVGIKKEVKPFAFPVKRELLVKYPKSYLKPFEEFTKERLVKPRVPKVEDTYSVIKVERPGKVIFQKEPKVNVEFTQPKGVFGVRVWRKPKPSVKIGKYFVPRIEDYKSFMEIKTTTPFDTLKDIYKKPKAAKLKKVKVKQPKKLKGKYSLPTAGLVKAGVFEAPFVPPPDYFFSFPKEIRGGVIKGALTPRVEKTLSSYVSVAGKVKEPTFIPKFYPVVPSTGRQIPGMKPKQISRSISRLHSRLQSRLQQRLIPRLTPRLQPRMIPRTEIRMISRLITRLHPRLITRLKPRLVQRMVPRTVTRIPPKSPKLLPPFTTLSGGHVPTRRPKPKPLYKTLVRRKGKWFQIGRPAPKGKALRAGVLYTKKTLGAAFQIIPVGKKTGEFDIRFTVPKKVFRKPRRSGVELIGSPIYVQRGGIDITFIKGARLATPSERKEIQMFKMGKVPKSLKFIGG